MRSIVKTVFVGNNKFYNLDSINIFFYEMQKFLNEN